MGVKEYLKTKKQELLNKELVYTILACADKEDVQALLDAGARLDDIIDLRDAQISEYSEDGKEYGIEFIFDRSTVESFARVIAWDQYKKKIKTDIDTMERNQQTNSEEYKILVDKYEESKTSRWNFDKAEYDQIITDFESYLSTMLPILLQHNLSQEALNKALVMVCGHCFSTNTVQQYVTLLLDAGADVNAYEVIQYRCGATKKVYALGYALYNDDIRKLFIEKGGISDDMLKNFLENAGTSDDTLQLFLKEMPNDMLELYIERGLISQEAAKAAGIILPIKEAIRDVVDSNLDGHDHPLNKGMEEHNKFDGCHEGA
jgi:hypothetical protein